MKKVLLVTGGASGIGAATARLAAAQGYDVAVNYRTRHKEAEQLVADLCAAGTRALAVKADVSEPAAIGRMFDTVVSELGPVTALVNSAGIFLSPTRVDEAEAESVDRMIRTNVVGLMICCREAARRMSTTRGGRGGVVINVSSMAGTIGGRPGSSHYAASKAAVDAFTMGFAKEVAREGIRAISVRPGFVATGMSTARLEDPAFAASIAASIPIGRPAQVDEVAKPIVWLLSSEASFITGACIDISGGGFVIGAVAPRS